MLRINNTKRKTGAGVVAVSLLSLSVWSYLNLAYIPNYVNATEDPRTMDDIDYMQEITPTICNNTPEADAAGNNQFTLTDKRDGKTYTVAKLKDGNCWMTQNLAIVNKTISNTDSDMGNGTFTIPNSNIDAFYYSSLDNTDLETAQMYLDTTFGGYYNWFTATAGSGTVELINSDGYNINNNAPSSICPRGWQLPTSNNNSDKSFGALMAGLTAGSEIISNPYNYIYGGMINYRQAVSQNSAGHYWSSTPGNTNVITAHLSLTDSTINASDNSWVGSGGRWTGMSVRCVNSDTRYNEPLGPNQSYGDISVTIPSILTVDATSDIDANTTPASITSGTITATVSSNTSYDIFLSADEPNLTNSADPTGPNISASNNVTPGVSAWGLKTSSNTYVPITKTTQIYDNDRTTDPAGNDVYTYGLGISIAPSLPSGTYSTDVTITVSSK